MENVRKCSDRHAKSIHAKTGRKMNKKLIFPIQDESVKVGVTHKMSANKQKILNVDI